MVSSCDYLLVCNKYQFQLSCLCVRLYLHLQNLKPIPFFDFHKLTKIFAILNKGKNKYNVFFIKQKLFGYSPSWRISEKLLLNKINIYCFCFYLHFHNCWIFKRKFNLWVHDI